MFREFSSGSGAAGCAGWFSASASTPCQPTGMLVLRVLLLLVIAFGPGKLLAQSAPTENSSVQVAQPSVQNSAGATVGSSATPAATASQAATPTSDSAPKVARDGANEPSTSSAQPNGGEVLPPAMATKSKLPAHSDYDEVHVKPMVKSEETAKFNPNSCG